MDTTIQYYGTGRRKRARARIFLRPGNGNLKVNDRTLTDYFPNPIHRMEINRPLATTETEATFDLVITVRGGGPTAQAEAVRHGISRALLQYNHEFRPPLKKEGLLTRDAREVERKKYGQPGARKNFQFSKR